MKVERTPAGLEMHLRVTGIGRFFSAGFLAFWMCGWAVGEYFALWFLLRAGYALVMGEPLRNGHKPIELAGMLVIGAFLLIWLTLWTVGGVAAGMELLRRLFGRDRILVGPDSLEIKHHYGLF